MHTRREFLTSSAIAMAMPPLAGCDRISKGEYAQAAQELRRPPGGSNDLLGLIRYATLAANGHNTQPWRFTIGDGRISIRPDFSRRTVVVDPDDHHLFVSLGCAAENLAIAAAALGRPAGVMISPEGHIELELATGAPSRGDLYQSIPLRQCTRSVYDSRAAPAARLRQLESVAAAPRVSLRLLTGAGDREAILEYIVAGNSAQMDDPAFVAELLRWIRFDPSEALARRDGLYAAASGNPTVPGWAGRRLFRWAFRKTSENDKYARQIRSSVGVAVFVAEQADRSHWVQAGRAVQRFALQCTALGMSCAFVNQAVEVPAVRREFARWLGIGDGRPDLVVRFGTGPRLPPSIRRRVDSVIEA